MSPAKNLYQQYVAQLPIETQLELLEIIIQKTLKKIKSKNDELEEVKESGVPDSVKPVEGKSKKQPKKRGEGNSPQEKELTELQKMMLKVPVMSEEDYELYLAKRANKWK